MSNDHSSLRDARLQEFAALRAEMLSILSDRLWGQVTYAALAGGVLAFADADLRVPCLAFVVLAAIPLLLHTAQREHARIRMANYIRAVLEPAVPGLSWEAYLSYWRRQRSQGHEWLGLVDRLRHVAALSGVQLTVAIFAWILLVSGNTPPWTVILATVALFLLLLVLWYFLRLYPAGARDYASLKALANGATNTDLHSLFEASATQHSTRDQDRETKADNSEVV